MRRVVTIWVQGALFAALATTFTPANHAKAQDFKIPVSVSPFVYRSGENLAELEHLRGWTFGLGLMIGVREAYSDRQRGIYGLVAKATYGGPYWYWSAGAGMWNSGSPMTDNFGFGVNFHYNVFQSRDFRTRLGPQFGWSKSISGDRRTHVLTYRAVISHALSQSLNLYGGVGAETSRFSASGNTIRSTNPSLLGGIYARLDDQFAFSTGVESVFSDPLTLTFASSVQFEPGFGDNGRLLLRQRDAKHRPPARR